MPKSTIPEQAVIFKGIEQGILILLDTSHDYEKIIKKTIQKIKANKKFLSENTLFIRGADGPLDPDELGMARKMIRDKTKMEVLPLSLNIEINDRSTQNLPLAVQPPTIVSCMLRAGQELRCDGDIILFGDTHPGSKIFSKGSVMVFGKIRGEVYAGEPDNKNALIVAQGFSPLQASLGGITMGNESKPEFQNTAVVVKVIEDKLEIMTAEAIANE